MLLSISAVKEPTTSPGADTNTHESQGRESLEQDVFLVLANVVRNQAPRSSESVWTAIQALSDWMEAVMAASGTGMLAENGNDHAMTDSARGRLQALGELVVALGANPGASKILGETGRKEKKLSFQSSLSLFSPYIQMQNPELAQRLEALKRSQQSPRQSRNMKGGEGIDEMIMDLDAVQPDIPMVHSRYHLFVWLNGLVIVSAIEPDHASLTLAAFTIPVS